MKINVKYSGILPKNAKENLPEGKTVADMGTLKKYIVIIEAFSQRNDRILDSYDELLLEKLNISPRQLGRLLEELEAEFDNIVLQKEGRKKRYKLVKPVDLFVETFKNHHQIGWLYNMAIEADPEIFKELENYTNQDKEVYKFKNTPFEDISEFESKEIFQRLKTAVQFGEYRDIKFRFEEKVRRNLKCIKLVFMDNNWYIAYVNEEDKLEFGRISFIEDVFYSKNKTSFQKSSVEKHKRFLDEEFQNSMTLYGVEKKRAVLKATPEVARYFEKGMKKFLSTQTFKKKLKDGSIIFTVDYTQELEILPFVQKWLPDVIVLEPEELKEIYRNKLKKALDMH